MSRWMLITVLVLTAQVSWSRNMERGPVREPARTLDANPQDENIALFNDFIAANVTNFGYWGYHGPSQVEDTFYCGWWRIPGFEYPLGSGVNFLSHSALWIGAEVETDSGYVKRVSIGTDGWQNPSINEFHAGQRPNHGIILRSNMLAATDCYGNRLYDPHAQANYEAISVYTDTLADRLFVRNDPDDGPHRPLGLQITQTARLWKNPEFARFVILEFRVMNIGSDNLRNIYLGLFADADIGRFGINYEHTDDLSGSILVDSSQGRILAWSADIDGYPNFRASPPLDYPDAFGVVALTDQSESIEREFATSFNWYLPNGDVDLDYGPYWADSSNGDWIVVGTPEGDRSKYHLLSNRERDYDEATLVAVHAPQLDTMWVCVSDWEEHLWVEYDWGQQFEISQDTRFLLSYGPLGSLSGFDSTGNCITQLNPGQELTFTLAMLIGEDFHDPDNPQMPGPIDTSKYDYSGLLETYRAAKRIYDSNYEFQPMTPVPAIRVYQALDRAVDLRWDAPEFGMAVGYVVTGRPDSGRGQEVQFTPEPISDRMYRTAGLTNGDWWQFSITALDEGGPSAARDTMIRIGAIPNWITLSGKVIRGRDSLWWNVSNDPLRTGYELVRTSAVDTITYDNITERTFVDSSVVSGREYTYRLNIINALGVEGLPTNAVALTPFVPDANIFIFDETKRPNVPERQRGFVDGDSVRLFYERIFTALGESYEYYDLDDELVLPSLEQLARHEIVYLNQENILNRLGSENRVRQRLLDDYVNMGGKLIRSGRGVFYASGGPFYEGIAPIDSFGTLTFDSVLISRAFSTPRPWSPRAIGASAIDTTFPPFLWDSTKVRSILYVGLIFNYLWDIDLMWPNGETQPVYGIVLDGADTTGFDGSPCAVIGPRTMLFTFPIYFVPEQTAQRIIEFSLEKLRSQVLDTPEPPVEPLPTSVVLHQNYPNPFNATTVIEFELPVMQEVTLNVYNIQGRLVETLRNGNLNAGYHRVNFDAAGLSSGLYFYRLETSGVSQTKKLLLLK